VLEAEAKKAALEVKERRAEHEARALEADRDAKMKLEQAKLAHEIRVLELKAQQTQLGEDAGDDGATPSEPRGEGNLALQTKRFGEMMRHVLPKMPAESAELPQFFETVEKVYVMYAVPEVVQAKLLIPLLTAQAKSLFNRMSIEEMGKYDELKQLLLAEYKLTPHEYKTRFESSTKTADETYTLFAARLRNLLTYYLDSRLVSDYRTLIELLLSDRLKGSLLQGILNYVLTQEGEGWYASTKVASLADVYANNRATVVGQKVTEGKAAKVATAGISAGSTAGQSFRGARSVQFQSGRGGGYGGPQSPTRSHKVKCYAGGELGHMAKDCPHIQAGQRGGYGGGPYGGFRGGHRGNPQGGGVRVNLISTARQPQVETREMGIHYDGGQVNLIQPNIWEFGAHPIVDAVSTVKTNPSVCIYPLQYVNVTVAECDCFALEDSGCQILLVSSRLFSWCCNETVGSVTLHGFGKNHTVQAPLVNLTVCIRDDERDDLSEIPIVFAVTDLCASDYDVILPADVARELQAAYVAVNVSSCDLGAVCDVGTETNDSEVEDNAPEDVDSLPVSG